MAGYFVNIVFERPATTVELDVLNHEMHIRGFKKTWIDYKKNIEKKLEEGMYYAQTTDPTALVRKSASEAATLAHTPFQITLVPDI